MECVSQVHPVYSSSTISVEASYSTGWYPVDWPIRCFTLQETTRYYHTLPTGFEASITFANSTSDACPSYVLPASDMFPFAEDYLHNSFLNRPFSCPMIGHDRLNAMEIWRSSCPASHSFYLTLRVVILAHHQWWAYCGHWSLHGGSRLIFMWDMRRQLLTVLN